MRIRGKRIWRRLPLVSEREIPLAHPVHFPVNSVLAGRRNSPPDPEIGLPPLAVYGPIHYQELPELFMEFISSLTGKSPSMTGFGSEGALTKSPFNALWPVVDLNNALLAAILTGDTGFTTSAGYVGPRVRVDHDISMLVPEIWCRMRVHERHPQFMIAEGLFERMEDFEFEGRKILASRLGYRITSKFVDRFLGRLFETPDVVFSEEMLRPEKQGLELFAAGIDAIVEAQQRVALNYFEDGSVEFACPPLKGLLYVMARGEYEGMGLEKTLDFAGCFSVRRCWKALGIRNVCAASRAATSRCGSAIWQISNNFRIQGLRWFLRPSASTSKTVFATRENGNSPGLAPPHIFDDHCEERSGPIRSLDRSRGRVARSVPLTSRRHEGTVPIKSASPPAAHRPKRAGDGVCRRPGFPESVRRRCNRGPKPP